MHAHTKHKPSDADVTEANRRFYDEIAPAYDAIDSRRNSGEEHAWLSPVLAALADRTRKPQGAAPSFLDAGSGTGFLVKRARRDFGRCIAVDISARMLERIADPEIEKILAALDRIPLPDGSLDCVGAFATLHHLHSPQSFFAEAYRLLRMGGALYTDHDISAPFVERYRAPLGLYRRFFDHGKKYLRNCPGAHAHDYELSEFHGDRGLDGEILRRQLLELGFREVEISHHWQGMGVFEVAERLAPRNWLARAGNSPILRIIAIK